jgi:hypothetical protein
VEGTPISLCFAREILAQGKETYVDIIRKSSMADGCHWVWQPDKPVRAPTHGGYAAQRGRGVGFQGRPSALQ